MTRLPMVDPLDQIEIASPCEVPWESMRGDDRVRFCGRCRQNVFNVEALSRAEARDLMQSRQGRLCMRFYRRPDGTVVTADCWTLLRQARRRGWLAFGAALVVLLWTQIAAQVVGLRTLFFLLQHRTPRSIPCAVAPLPTPRAPEVIDVPAQGGIAGPYEPSPQPAPPPAPRRLGGAIRIMGKRAAPQPEKKPLPKMGEVNDEPYTL
jgi:hypothetical protein